MNKFEQHLQNDLNNEVPDVLNKIKQDHRFKVPVKEQKSFLDNFRFNTFSKAIISAFLVVVLAVIVLNTSTDTQVYATTVTLEINPSIVIQFDEEDRVMSIEALNDDGESIIDSSVNFNKMDVNDLIEYLVKALYEGNYLENSENVFVLTTEGTSSIAQDRILQSIETRINVEIAKYERVAQFLETKDMEFTRAEIAKMKIEYRRENITLGHAIMIEYISNNSDYDKEDLKEKDTRELYDIVKEVREKK